MVNINVDRLVKLKKFYKDDLESQDVPVQDVERYIVEDYFERSKKYLDIKNYFESRFQGLTFNISCGGKKHNGDEFDFNPIIIESYKHNQQESYNKIKLDGVLLGEDPSVIYDEYLDVIVSNPSLIETCHKSIWEIVINDTLGKYYFTESGFAVIDNQLVQFIDNKMYTIIDNIEASVQGVIVLNLPNELDESIIVVCIDKVILVSEDCYYIDLGLN